MGQLPTAKHRQADLARRQAGLVQRDIVADNAERHGQQAVRLLRPVPGNQGPVAAHIHPGKGQHHARRQLRRPGQDDTKLCEPTTGAALAPASLPPSFPACRRLIKRAIAPRSAPTPRGAEVVDPRAGKQRPTGN